MASVLIVDDSPTIRRMVRASLASVPGLSFREAGNGLDAIESLVVTPFDLMILDLNMPDMHGLDVLKFVRGQERFTSVPIVVLTTRGDEASREAAVGAGATRFLTKPFAPRALAAEVTALLHGTPGQQPPAPSRSGELR